MIPSLALWFDAADATTITQSAGAVSQWRDKSSNAYSVLQDTSAYQPTYATNLLNGLPGIQLSASTYLYQVCSSIPNFTSGSQTTVYMVAKNGSTMPAWNIINTIWFGGTGTQRYHFSFGYGATNGITLYTNGGVVASPSSSVVPLNTNAIIGFAASATSNYIFYNGSNTAYASSGGLVSANNSTLFQFGDLRGAIVTDENIYEFVGFNTVLTTAQQQAVEGYLATKWGLQSSLSNGHPYKTTPLPAPPVLAISPVYPTSTVLSAEFDPRVNPNCILWLDGADPLGTGTAPAPGSSIVTWVDKSVSANNFTIRSGYTDYPTSATDGIYRIMNWVSAQPFISANSIDFTNSTMIFIVYKYTTTSFANLFGIGNGISSDINIRVNYNNAVNVININVNDIFYNNTGGTSTSMYVNGQNYSSSTVNTLTSYNIVNGFIFSGGRSQFNICSQYLGRTFSGYIAEILLYENPTSTQRQQVEAYLAKKWGLSAVLSTQNQYAPGSYLSFVNAPIMPAPPMRRAAQMNMFQPTQISGCVLWLDGKDPAGTGSKPTPGTAISTWADKSTNGKNGTATGTPTYSSPGINFTGSSYFLNQSFSQNLSQRSIFIVMQETTHIPVAGVFPLIPNPSSGTDYQTTTGLSIETSNGLRFYGNNGSYVSDFGNITLLVKAIYNDNMNGTAGSSYLNGAIANTNTAGYTAGTCSGYGVGARWGGSVSMSSGLNGIIFEIIYFSRPLLSVERQQIEGYLAWKWGLKNSLGQGHPYFLVPPTPAQYQ